MYNDDHLHSLRAENLWLASNDHCVSLCLAIHEVIVCSLHPVVALHRLCLTRLPLKSRYTLNNKTTGIPGPKFLKHI